MNSQDNKEQELQRREQELQARERALRLQELEAEINKPVVYQTVKHQALERPPQRRYGRLLVVGKFLVLVVAVVVCIRLVTSLAYLIMIGAVAWVAYKLFLDGDRSKK